MYAAPKKRFLASGDIRKFANGHCTATNVPRNAAARSGARTSGRHDVVRLSAKSNTAAGTINRSGNSHGMKWVTGLYTGPSFGVAGKSGRTHRNATPNSVYTSVTMVLAHRCREATA